MFTYDSYIKKVSISQDVLELYRMGLIFESKGNIILTIGQINLNSIITMGIENILI